MKSQIIEFDLGREGLLYVKDCLGKWGGLAEKATNLPILEGRATAILPKDATLARAIQFEIGGLNIGGLDTKYLSEHFEEISKTYKYSSIVIEDTIALSTDEAISKIDCQKFFHKSRVYYYLNSEQFGVDSIPDLLYASRGFVIIGFFIKEHINDGLVLNLDVDSDALCSMGRDIQEIFVSAYDGESFVIWSK